MKKLFTLGLASIMTAGMAFADAPSITLLDEPLEVLMQTGGYMPQCISPNGKYLCGSGWTYAPWASQWQEQKTKIFTAADGAIITEGDGQASGGSDFACINSSGTAVGWDDGGAAIMSAATFTYGRYNFDAGNIRVTDVMLKAISDDGVVVGAVKQYGKPYYDAAIWVDNKLTILPVPTAADAGFRIYGSEAYCISLDGNVVLGKVVDRYGKYPPMVAWYRQEDGSYKLDPICSRFYSDPLDTPIDKANPYAKFHAFALSPNGKLALISLKPFPKSEDEPLTDVYTLAIMNLETETLRLSKTPDQIPDYMLLEVLNRGISDAGTVVGYYAANLGENQDFIMYYDEMVPRPVSTVFPQIAELADFEENDFCALSSITPDGRYFTGVGYQYFYFPEMGGGNWALQGFVVDTGEVEVNAVEAVQVDNDDNDAPAEYFTLDGVRHQDPVKGINIVRRGSKTEKVIL